MQQLSLLLSLLLFAPLVLAQDVWVASIETDQATYAYGEPIEVRFTVTNTSNQPATLIGTDGCASAIEMGSLLSPGEFGPCTLEEPHYEFGPGQSRTWTWDIIPEYHGVPEEDGMQEVIGHFFRSGNVNLTATTTVDAPRFLGGLLYTELAEGVTLDDVEDVLEALNVVVVETDMGPVWSISGTALLDAVALYEDDPRFAWISPFRQIYPRSTTVSADEETPRLAAARLSAVYPNPLTASGAFTLTVPHTESVEVAMFDLLGRRVATLQEGVLTGEAEHAFTLSAEGLPSGVYVVRAAGESFVAERRVTVLR